MTAVFLSSSISSPSVSLVYIFRGKIPWRRPWQSTPVCLLGESHGQRNLVGYTEWGRKESDRLKRPSTLVYLQSLSGVHSLSPPLPLTVWSQAPSSCLDGGNGLLPSTAVLVLPPSQGTLFPAVRGLLLQQKWNHSSAPKAPSGAIPRHFSV